MLYFVYDLVDPRTDVPFYVGLTNNPNLRYKQHLDVRRWLNLKKDQKIAQLRTEKVLPKMRILAVVYSKEEACERERYWVQTYLHQGINLTNQRLIVDMRMKTSHTPSVTKPKKQPISKITKRDKKQPMKPYPHQTTCHEEIEETWNELLEIRNNLTQNELQKLLDDFIRRFKAFYADEEASQAFEEWHQAKSKMIISGGR